MAGMYTTYAFGKPAADEGKFFTCVFLLTYRIHSYTRKKFIGIDKIYSFGNSQVENLIFTKKTTKQIIF